MRHHWVQFVLSYNIIGFKGGTYNSIPISYNYVEETNVSQKRDYVQAPELSSQF